MLMMMNDWKPYGKTYIKKKKMFAIGSVKFGTKFKLIVLTLCLKIKTTF
jgi:hypothetical protein